MTCKATQWRTRKSYTLVRHIALFCLSDPARKLTYRCFLSGKVLPDDKTVESCNIKEKDFLVLMVSKVRPQPCSSHYFRYATVVSDAFTALRYLSSAHALVCSPKLHPLPPRVPPPHLAPQPLQLPHHLRLNLPPPHPPPQLPPLLPLLPQPHRQQQHPPLNSVT